MDEAAYNAFPADLMVEQGGAQVPLRDTPFFKEAPDMGTFYKNSWQAHREVGARIPLKVDKSNPVAVAEWRTKHLPQFYEAGVLDAPPKSPDEYELVKPEKLPDGMLWNDDLAKEFKTVLHKHGIPKAAVADLVALQAKAIGATTEGFKVEKEAGIAALKQEFGAEYDKRMAMVPRLTKEIFKSEEDIALAEKLGLGNHPGFLGLMMRLAHVAEGDSSFAPGGNSGGGGMSGDDVRAELAAIQTDPKHADYEGYKRRDPKVMAKIEAMYKAAYGSATVDLGGGVTVGAKPA